MESGVKEFIGEKRELENELAANTGVTRQLLLEEALDRPFLPFL